MELFIIRHAQSSNNALPDQTMRVVDPLLTDLGQRQAELLAMHLATGADHESKPCETEPANGCNGNNGFGLTRLVTSPMYRALLTTRPIARALGLRPEVWPDIYEHGGMWLDHGGKEGIVGYPGLSRAEILACLPEASLPDQIADHGWYDPAQGHETLAQAAQRAGQVAAGLRARMPSDERIALVTHGGFSSLLLSALFGLPPEAPIFFHHDNTGITWLRFGTDGRIRLRYMNRIAHLPAELVT